MLLLIAQLLFHYLNFSPYQIVFHTHSRIPLTISLKLSRDSSNTCIATYFVSLPPHTHFSNKDLNTILHSLLEKPVASRFLSAEQARLEIYSTVHHHITNKLISQKSTFETTHLIQLPLKTFVIHTIFKPVNFSQSLNTPVLAHKKLQHLSVVTY